MPKIGEYYAELGVHGLGGMFGAFAAVRKGLAGLAATAVAPIASLGGSLTSLLNPLSMVGGAIGALGMGAGVGGLVKLAADAESTQTAFEVMLGSADKARTMVGDLKKMGAATPFEFTGLSQAAKSLLNFGISGDQVLGTLDTLSNVAMGDNNKLQSLALVFGQISSTGRLTGGDLLQLINTGFNPLLTISKQTGRSMADLKKDMEAGLISFDQVKRAFEAETQAGGRFYGMNEKMSKTLGGLWSSASDAVTAVLTRIGESLVDVFDLKGAVKSLTGFAETFQAQYGDRIREVLAGVRDVAARVWDGLKSAGQVVLEVFNAVSQSIAGVAGEGGGLSGVLSTVWGFIQSGGQVAMGIFRTISQAIASAAGEGGILSQVFSGLGSVASSLGSAFMAVAGLVVQGWQALGSALSSVVGESGLIQFLSDAASGLFDWVSGLISAWTESQTFRGILTLIQATGETMGALLKAAIDNIKAAWNALLSLPVAEWFGGVEGQAGASLDSMASGVVAWVTEWVQAAGFMLRNWDISSQLLGEYFFLFLQNTWERIKTFFVNCREILSWFGDNWADVLKTAADFVLTVFGNLKTNIIALWNAVLDFFKTGHFQVNFTDITEGFKSSIKELPQLTAPAIQESNEAIDRLNNQLAQRQADELARRGLADDAKRAKSRETPPAEPEYLDDELAWIDQMDAPSKPGTTPPRPFPGQAARPQAAQAQAAGFVGLADLAKQMQTEAGKRMEEQMAAETKRTADAVSRLAGAANGGALNVNIVGGGGPKVATYAP